MAMTVAACGVAGRKVELDIGKTPGKLQGMRRDRLLGRLKAQGNDSTREGRAAASRGRNCGFDGREVELGEAIGRRANERRDLKGVAHGQAVDANGTHQHTLPESRVISGKPIASRPAG